MVLDIDGVLLFNCGCQNSIEPAGPDTEIDGPRSKSSDPYKAPEVLLEETSQITAGGSRLKCLPNGLELGIDRANFSNFHKVLKNASDFACVFHY